jgi:hypothetical protein
MLFMSSTKYLIFRKNYHFMVILLLFVTNPSGYGAPVGGSKTHKRNIISSLFDVPKLRLKAYLN